MQTRDGLLTRRVLPTVLGLALTGWISTMPSTAKADHDNDANRDQDELTIDPQPVGYPFAAPGSLDMYHWTDYTMSKLAPGSAHEARAEKMRKHQEKMRKDTLEFHKRMIDNDDLSSDNSAPTPNYASTYEDDVLLSPDTSVWIGMPVATNSDPDHFYVLNGNTLYQYDANDLSLSATNSLPLPDAAFDLAADQTAEDTADFSGDDAADQAADTIADFEAAHPLFQRSSLTAEIDPRTTIGDVGDRPETSQDEYEADLNGSSAADDNYKAGTNDEYSDITDAGAADRTYFHRRSATDQPSDIMKPATITATPDYVYVVKGDMLYQLRTSDLSLINVQMVP